MYDLIIIGASAAGVSAAIYAARRNLNFIILAKDVGGEVARSGEVENYLGFTHTDGFELTQKFQEQLEYYKVNVKQPYEVTKVSKLESGQVSKGAGEQGSRFQVTTKNPDGKEEIFEAKAVIVASGIHPKLLNVPGEDTLWGKGVTYCTTCDGPLYKGKVTATIGGGNSALESALMMAGIATKVYVINKNNIFKGEQVLVDKVNRTKNIEVFYGAITQELVAGEGGLLKGVVYRSDDGIRHTIDVQGVMVHIGNIPNSDMVDVDKDQFKNIIINDRCETSIPGLFAAGDVTNVAFKQIIIAAGQGAIAALAAVEYLNRREH